MKRKDSRLIGDILKDFLEEEPNIHEGLLERQAIIVVRELLERELPFISHIDIHEGKLVVQTTSSVIRHHLSLQRETLVRQINERIQAELLRQLILI
ncbi:DciA family protein [Porphyromonas sp. COT-239 OH1446]|uniref:DciA family protein n=1 Tax=Porphyromonas sp. COT-239 OH1446 TaxID=1515613 RepID=UPI00052D35DC|nr:DciA family protein [Porphyromonas sp. COT-239 OH1446]KGN68431.1 hypothetical protein HQ37_06530 [Porphyromonas sp. COT-239 OH1446]